MQDALTALVEGRTLCEAQSHAVFAAILEGREDAARIGALLALLQQRIPTVDELVGAARVMRERVTRVPIDEASLPGPLIDTCGTGGAPKVYNVSTAAAIIAASARGGATGAGTGEGVRICVAKHGNRSRTGRGSAEVLAALGVNVEATPQTQAQCLRDVGVCFSFAIYHHPAMQHAAGVRKALGFPTIFNLLGPLTNPAGARRQLIGVYDERYVDLIARALARLDCDSAIVAYGGDGLDEITIADDTIAARVSGGRVESLRITPEEAGLTRGALAGCAPRTVKAAAALMQRVLSGEEEGPALDIAHLNAAAALLVGGSVEDLREGVALAREAVGAGQAAATLKRLAQCSKA